MLTMFRKTDLSIFLRERHRPKLSISKQYDEIKPVQAEETSVRSRLRERFPRLFGSKKNSKIIPVVKIDVEEYVPTRLTDIDTTVFAQELTMLEKEMFCSIELKEIIDRTWKKPQPYLSPNVTRMTDFHSRLAGVIATEVLAQKEPVARAEIIAKVIAIADCCASLYNYQAVKTLLGALQAFPVARLLKTWRKLPRKSKSLLRKLIVLSSESLHALFSRHKASCENSPDSLQYIGDVMTQINYIEDVVYSDVKQTKSTHSQKLHELQDLLSSYKNAARGYCFERHPAVAKFLTSSASVNSVNGNLEMSKRREPDAEEKKIFY